MNCEQVRENLYDYLDDELSSSEKAAVERHLAECFVCREAAQRERQLAQSFSSRLEQVVETVALDAVARRAIATAAERKITESRKQPVFLFWRRLALSFALAAMILITAIVLIQPDLTSPTVRVPMPANDRTVLISVSYSLPTYAFQKEGNMVIDALTSDTRVADGALLVKK